MAKEIFNTKGMAESIRYTEYKDIYSAISEIVDNSIEANAKDVIVILRVYQQEGKETIDKIAVLDNGYGMDDSTLQECLVFGSSTKKDRVLMGRFGVGLGQASLYAAPRVEVYSWQHGLSSKYVYLDTEQMKNGQQTEIPTPTEKELPDVFSTYKSLNHFVKDKRSVIDFSENGTMIVWEKVDKIPGRVSTFKSKLSEELGRKFRYYLQKGVKILITDTAYSFIEDIKPIDPMFLMSRSKILGNPLLTTNLATDLAKGEAIFEPFDSSESPDGEYVFGIVIDKKDQKTVFGDVRIRASVVKEKYYYGGSFNTKIKKSPGDTEIGQTLKKYENISMVRAGREIQFDKFGLYDSVNKPTNRWWSIEIEFDPSLDEFFKLSNNKQKVEIITSHYQSFIDSKNKKALKNLSYDDVESMEEKYWIELVQKVKTLISLMTSRNKKIQNKYTINPEITNGDDNGIKNEKVYQPIQDQLEPNASQLIEKLIDEKTKSLTSNPSNHRQYDENYQLDCSMLIELVSDITTDNLFDFEKDSQGLFSKVNFDHAYFDLKQHIDHQDMDEVILNFFVHVLSKIKEKMKTYESRKMFDDFVRQINEEVNDTLKKMLKKEE